MGLISTVAFGCDVKNAESLTIFITLPTFCLFPKKFVNNPAQYVSFFVYLFAIFSQGFFNKIEINLKKREKKVFCWRMLLLVLWEERKIYIMWIYRFINRKKIIIAQFNEHNRKYWSMVLLVIRIKMVHGKSPDSWHLLMIIFSRSVGVFAWSNFSFIPLFESFLLKSKEK